MNKSPSREEWQGVLEKIANPRTRQSTGGRRRNQQPTVNREFHITHRRHGRKQLRDADAQDAPSGRVPSISRLMALATDMVIPFSGAVSDDILTKATGSADRWRSAEDSNRDGIQSHLVDQLMKSWDNPRARPGYALHAAHQPSAALHSSSAHRARFHFAADGEAENVDDLLENTLDLMVPGLLVDGWHGMRG